MFEVTPKNIDKVVDILSATGQYGLDTETEGLLEKHRLFSIVISDEKEDYYFNFRNYGIDHTSSIPLLSKDMHFPLIANILSNTKSTFFLSNAKFDMTMLGKEQVLVKGSIWDTAAMGRVLDNDKPSIKSYSLDSLAKEYLGLEKDDAVKTYIEQNKLWDEERWYGEAKKHHRYQDVPYEIMLKYACLDGNLVRKIGLYQKKMFRELEKNKNEPKISQLVANEMLLTKTLYHCQRVGVKVNRLSVKEAIKTDSMQVNSLKQEFLNTTGFDFYDGPQRLKEVFTHLGIPIGKTEKGNDSFSKGAFKKIDHRVIEIIENIRWLEKRKSTYYPGLLYYSDMDGIIHPDHIQHGARTGRMSCREPNLTNIPARGEGDAVPMRSHFIPRYSNSCFVSLDYKQQELRLMFDLAGETKLIQQVNDGADLHEATASLNGLTRDHAKTVNFALAYGQGIEELAKNLGVTRKEAIEIKKTYFGKMPKTKKWINSVMNKGNISLKAINWFGRRCFISDKDHAYTLPNAAIQGGCADMIKIAMNGIFKKQSDLASSPGMLFSVHDELLLELLPEDFDFVGTVKEIMEKAYSPLNGMRFDVDVNHSFKSWAEIDMCSGGPCIQKITSHQNQNSHQMLTGSTL